ncbi:MAG: magnesium transporter [Candidatus Omnitrophica bacterium]|nr:magnesium transporter [Candidatus Omnitrophota bacterium]
MKKNIDLFALFLPEIKEFLLKKDFNNLKQLLKNMHPMDLAEGWHNLSQQEKIIVFKLLGTRKAIEVFENLPFYEQNFILNNIDNNEVAQIINEMAPDDRADLFKELSSHSVKKLFSLVSKEQAQNVRKLLQYKEGTAGSLMTTDFVEFKKDMTAKQALIFLQENLRSTHRENVYSIYVTDGNHKLIGSVSLQDLLKAPPDIYIKDIMTLPEFIKVETTTNLQEVARQFKKYDLLDVPVVDKDNVLLGIITIDDMVDIMEKETTKDIYEIGKMTARGGKIISYAQAKAFDLVKRRAGWLVLLLIFDFLTGTVLKNFEHLLSSVIALTFFIPMLLDTGGNAGAQTSTTIIRGLATGDVDFKNIFKVIRLESVAALFMSLIVGSVAFMRALLLQKDFSVAVVVGLSMMLIAILAITTGVALPLISKKIGLDPAVLAGPITTSIVDVCGLIIYFKVAQIFIPILRI